MKWKKYARFVLLPPFAVCLLLLPVATGALIYAFARLGEADPWRIAAYVLSFYTLLIWCVRFPMIVRFFCDVWRKNRAARRWLGDVRLRMRVTLAASVLWNGGYAILQFALGIYYRAAWFYSLGAYYALLALMRFFLRRHIVQHEPGAELLRELRHYRACGWVFLLMNLALSGMMLYRIAEKRLVRHHEIITIAMAAYTFASLTMAIVNVGKYRKYQSPVLSASRAISLAAASVSVLSLESTMLVTFNQGNLTARTQTLFLALSGGGVSCLIVAMAVYMIVRANQRIKAGEGRTWNRMKPSG